MAEMSATQEAGSVPRCSNTAVDAQRPRVPFAEVKLPATVAVPEIVGVPVDYRFEKSYSDFLPQVGVRYQLTSSQQVFLNVAKNFRAPPNFAFRAGPPSPEKPFSPVPATRL